MDLAQETYHTLKCRRCGEHKHRQRFRVRTKRGILYDYWCNTCRAKDFYVPPFQLADRLHAGLITRYRYDQLILQKEKNLKESQSKNGRLYGPYGEKKKEESWAQVERSARLFREYLYKVKPENEAAALWLYQAVALANHALAHVMDQKTKTFYARKGTSFWYDITPEIRMAVRAHVAEYPGEVCPIVVL